MLLRKARMGDVEAIQGLVNYFAERGEMLPRPLSEIYENLRDYYVAEVDGRLVGCVALHINWSDLVEVKSLAVDEAWQNQGVGRELVEACLHEAKELGLNTVFALTLAPDFFERLGFVRGNVDELPRKVWVECYRCPKFPKCDEIAMLYRFDTEGTVS
ncbi:MAG: N-acetyltransferase [Bacteroidetes bacterium]|nr:N-acetyltransferase [Bacteroidota bacterium]MCL5025911.1 N-acetyltransferase [Chloroflexota bacterium]